MTNKVNPIKTEKTEKITSETPIKKLLDSHPEVVEVLMDYGLNCVNCSFSSMDTLENGLKIHGLDHEMEMILRDLNRVVGENQ
ncbi:MAG: DUF1858 domain-containing protein [Candidatus Pacearchaeota archaeon]